MAIDEALLRFLDQSSNVRDLQITAGFDGGYRLSSNDKSNSSSTHAESLAVTIGSTVTLFSETVLANKRFSGFWFGGETNATFVVKLNGNILMKSKINQIQQERSVYFPNPYPAIPANVLTIEVTNNGTQTSDFECVVFEAV